MSDNNTIRKTFLVATTLCLVCSVVVSMAAVMLRPAQEANRLQDLRRNILAAANMYDPTRSVDEQFERVTQRIVNLETGQYSDEIDPAEFEQLEAARDPALSQELPDEADIAGISRRENYAEIYTVENDSGEIEAIILPIRGYGLWGTLYGFIALEADASTVIGLGYYQHQETPGLGGEVDNPRWKSQWQGKAVYPEDDVGGQVRISVVKGQASADDPDARYKVDGLSGATLTSRGVHNMLQYWLGEQGFGPFLKNLREGQA